MILNDEISFLIQKLRKRIVIAAHHYQKSEIVRCADIVGDSYKLAVECARRKADFILLCGVRFMAEGAAVLAGDGQRVVMPDSAAGCPMADMIDAVQTRNALGCIQTVTGKNPAPVVYMNSSVAVKAVCGEADGAVCTSSNAEKILRYFIEADRPVFFAPDRHLGENTVKKFGLLEDDRIAFFDSNGQIECSGDPRHAALFLWNGFCPIHRQFTADDVQNARCRFPEASVIVHPECDAAVVTAADSDGSTEFLLQTVRNAPQGTAWAVGTELSFVQRLAQECPDKTVFPLAEHPCADMALTTPQKLAAALKNIDNFIEGKESLQNQIVVPAETKADAAKALNRMIEITEEQK